MVWVDHSLFIHSFSQWHLLFPVFGYSKQNTYRQIFVRTEVFHSLACSQERLMSTLSNLFGPALSHFNKHTNHPKSLLSTDSDSEWWGLGFCIPTSSQATQCCWPVDHCEQWGPQADGPCTSVRATLQVRVSRVRTGSHHQGLSLVKEVNHKLASS